MPNLVSLITVEVSPSPSRAGVRVAPRNRRAMLKAALWPTVKAVVTISAILFRELFL
ncbi:hypothetical protein D3C71_2131280 [compost metagenome]